MLDIIIPTYNNLEALKITLNSIVPVDKITITVVNDGSTIDYDEIIKRSTDMIMKSMGNNYMTTLSKKEQEALNATLNKTNGSQNSNMSKSQKSGGASKVEEKKIADAELI